MPLRLHFAFLKIQLYNLAVEAERRPDLILLARAQLNLARPLDLTPEEMEGVRKMREAHEEDLRLARKEKPWRPIDMVTEWHLL